MIEIGFTGPQGIQGPPGEVTADLSSAIANTMNKSSANTNALPTMDVPFMNDPPTLADMETMRAAYNALVLGLRRP